jgi:hypothetical protein
MVDDHCGAVTTDGAMKTIQVSTCNFGSKLHLDVNNRITHGFSASEYYPSEWTSLQLAMNLQGFLLTKPLALTAPYGNVHNCKPITKSAA